MTQSKAEQPVTGKVELDTPIKRGEQVIDSLTLRKPRSGELRGIALTDVLQMQTDALIKLIPRLSAPALTEPEVREMDPADLVQCGSEVAGFLLTRQAKGDTA